MPRPLALRLALLSAPLCALLASTLAPARAEEAAPTPAHALLTELEAAKAAKDDGKWAEALKRVATVYADATEADKKALAAAAGAGLKSKADSVQLAALDALKGTKDGEAAWKAGLKAELPDPKAEAAKPFELKALEAVKELRPEGAVSVLMGLLQKAKDPKVCAAALEALGGYERSKQRVAILDELVKVIRNAKPSRASGGNMSAPTPRWTEMEGKVVPTLNALTGQSVADLDTWLQMYDENKKRPAALFKNPLE